MCGLLFTEGDSDLCFKTYLLCLVPTFSADLAKAWSRCLWLPEKEGVLGSLPLYSSQDLGAIEPIW